MREALDDRKADIRNADEWIFRLQERRERDQRAWLTRWIAYFEELRNRAKGRG